MGSPVPMTGLVTGSIVFGVIAVVATIGANMYIAGQATNRLSKSENRK